MRIYTARYLVTMATPPLEGGAILVDDDRIVAVGRLSELQQATAGAELVDFGDAVLLPPLINAHTHLELTDFPAWAQQANETEPANNRFVDWILQVIRVKRGQAAEAFVSSITRGLQLSLEAGTGAVADILSSPAACSAYQQTPLLGSVFYETLGRDPQLTRQQLSKTIKLFDDHPARQLKVGIAPHSIYTLSADYLEEVFALSKARPCPVSIHLAEPDAEVDLIRDGCGDLADTLFPFVGWQRFVPEASGLSPVAYLDAHNGLRSDVLLVHGVQVSADDVQRLKRNGCSMILCPRSNEQLGVGTAPVALYRESGIPLALGTDSLASNDSLSIWDELAAAARLYVSILTPDELLQAATVNGARLLGLGDEIGTLAAGRGAHFQVVDVPVGADLTTLSEALVVAGVQKPVRQVYLHGKPRLPN